jgi:hypothetical protein
MTKYYICFSPHGGADSSTLVGGESAHATPAVLWAAAIVAALAAAAAIGTWMPVTLAVTDSVHTVRGKIDERLLPHPGHGDEREVPIHRREQHVTPSPTDLLPPPAARSLAAVSG